jgi:LCP family protein required for cell wall assembly
VTAEPSSYRPGARPFLAALLSFLFPGVGQAYNGERRLAWIFAAPVMLLIVGAALSVTVARSGMLARLVDVRFLWGLLALDAALLAWRVVAIVQAHVHRERPSIRRWTTYATSVVLVVAVAMQALPAYWGWLAVDTLSAVAQGGGGGNSEVQNAFSGPLPGVDFQRQSDAPDVAKGERVNVLLVGVDWKPGRGEHLTDTMLVVSLDPATGQTAMISVPRDMYGVKLPDGRTFNSKLNALLITATLDKTDYPLGGVQTLKETIGNLLGIKISYFAAINLLGFKQAVDAIGGVDVTVTRAINDPTYFDEYDHQTGFYLQPGKYHMNGHLALAYVRSRKGIGDNDFTRAARQQQILTAIRAKLTAGNLLTAIPPLLAALKSSLTTDVPSDQIPVLAKAVENADMANIQRAVIQPPTYVTPATGPGGAYILVPNFKTILELGQKLMGGTGPASAALSPGPTPTP